VGMTTPDLPFIEGLYPLSSASSRMALKAVVLPVPAVPLN